MIRTTAVAAMIVIDTRAAEGIRMRQASYHAQSQQKQAEKLGVKAKKGSLSCVQIAMSL
jgi:hypothetical protein